MHPHIYRGVYGNDGDGIRAAVARLQLQLDREGIALRLVEGADVHLDPDLLSGIRAGRVPTIAGSRYLLEPPQHVAPPRLEESVFALMAAGYTPIITHPERLTWVETHYALFERISRRGAWMQVTAGALSGRFGRRVRYWAERFISDGYVMILATDAHPPQRRPPLLAKAAPPRRHWSARSKRHTGSSPARPASSTISRPTGFRGHCPRLAASGRQAASERSREPRCSACCARCEGREAASARQGDEYADA